MATKKLSYEEAMKKLETLVAQIEANELDVDLLVTRLKEAQELIAYCKDKLYKADAEIQKLLESEDA